MSFHHIPIARLLNEREGESIMQLYEAGDNEFLELAHVVLRISSDILAQACRNRLDISENVAVACIPDSLDMFLDLFLVGKVFFWL